MSPNYRRQNKDLSKESIQRERIIFLKNEHNY